MVYYIYKTISLYYDLLYNIIGYIIELYHVYFIIIHNTCMYIYSLEESDTMLNSVDTQ